MIGFLAVTQYMESVPTQQLSTPEGLDELFAAEGFDPEVWRKVKESIPAVLAETFLTALLTGVRIGRAFSVPTEETGESDASYIDTLESIAPDDEERPA